jgi:hypothetical protein
VSSTGFSSVDHDELASQTPTESSQKTGLHGTDIEGKRCAIKNVLVLDKAKYMAYLFRNKTSLGSSSSC